MHPLSAYLATKRQFTHDPHRHVAYKARAVLQPCRHNRAAVQGIATSLEDAMRCLQVKCSNVNPHSTAASEADDSLPMDPFALWKRDCAMCFQTALPEAPIEVLSQQLKARWMSMSSKQKLPYVLKALCHSAALDLGHRRKSRIVFKASRVVHRVSSGTNTNGALRLDD